MRGYELQQLLVTGVEGIAVDDKTSVADKFRHDPGESDDGNVKPDRVFELVQGQIKPSFTFEARTVTSVFELRFYYADGPRLAKRLISDGERVLCWLRGIGAAMHADIFGCSEIGDWIPAADDVPGQIVCVVSFAVTYSLTGI